MSTSKFFLIIVFISLLISGWFYWFQWRPARVRKICQDQADDYYKRTFELNDKDNNGILQLELTQEIKSRADDDYEGCLHNHGL